MLWYAIIYLENLFIIQIFLPMWIICPSVSNIIFPLCLSLICRRNPTREYAAIDFTKLERACWNLGEFSSPYRSRKYWHMPVSVPRPIWSRDLALGTHSMTPHWKCDHNDSMISKTFNNLFILFTDIHSTHFNLLTIKGNCVTRDTDNLDQGVY